MTPTDILPSLRPGDLLLYSRRGFIDTAIKVKTWSPFTHVETYIGGSMAAAARNDWKCWGHARPGTGVGLFPVCLEDLVLVRRPCCPFHISDAMTWHRTVDGQAYDLFGLFRFFTLGRQSDDKQFCSEHATRFARHGGVRPFAESVDADLVSPGMLAGSVAYDDVMVNGGIGVMI